jgi:hypothetical protein
MKESSMVTRGEHMRFRLAVIEAVAAHGFLTAQQISRVTGQEASEAAMSKRLQRMQRDGLIKPCDVGPLRCWVATRQALAHIQSELPVVERIGASTARHALVTADVAIWLGSLGHGVTTERQLRLADRRRRDREGYTRVDRADVEQKVRVLPDGSRVRISDPCALRRWLDAWMPEHRPDLVLERFAGHLEAIEVELSVKKPLLIQRKLHWYAKRQGRATLPQNHHPLRPGADTTEEVHGYAAVHYLCGTEAVARAVHRAHQDAAPDLRLHVELIP